MRKTTPTTKRRLKRHISGYEKLSAEELVRLSRESLSCGSVLRHAHHREDLPMTASYGLAFENELVGRAEAVLVEHYLMREYLLKSSE